MDAEKSFNVINPFQKGQNRGRRTGKIISKKRPKRNDEMNSFDEYLSESAEEQSPLISQKVVPTKENLQPPPTAQIAKISPVVVIQSETQTHISSAHKETQESEDFIKALNPFAGNARYGRRTGKDLLAGKSKLLSNGMGNFSDFFSDSDASISMQGTPSAIKTPTVHSKDVFVKPQKVLATSTHLAQPVGVPADSGEPVSTDINKSKRNKFPTYGLTQAEQSTTVNVTPRDGAVEARESAVEANHQKNSANVSDDEANESDDGANESNKKAVKATAGASESAVGANQLNNESDNKANKSHNKAVKATVGAIESAVGANQLNDESDEEANKSNDRAKANESNNKAVKATVGASESAVRANQLNDESDDEANKSNDRAKANESNNRAVKATFGASESAVGANQLNDESDDEANKSNDGANKSDDRANKPNQKVNESHTGGHGNETLGSDEESNEPEFRVEKLDHDVANKSDHGASKSDHGANKSDHVANKSDHGANKSDHGANKSDHGANKSDVKANGSNDEGSESDVMANKSNDDANESENENYQSVNKANKSNNKLNKSAAPAKTSANKANQSSNSTKTRSTKSKDFNNSPGGSSDNEQDDANLEPQNNESNSRKTLNSTRRKSAQNKSKSSVIERPIAIKNDKSLSKFSNKAVSKSGKLISTDFSQEDTLSKEVEQATLSKEVEPATLSKEAEPTTLSKEVEQETLAVQYSAKTNLKDSSKTAIQSSSDFSKAGNKSSQESSSGDIVNKPEKPSVAYPDHEKSKSRKASRTTTKQNASRSHNKSSEQFKEPASLKKQKSDKSSSDKNVCTGPEGVNLALEKQKSISLPSTSQDQEDGKVTAHEQKSSESSIPNTKDTESCLNFGGDVAGSLSKTFQAQPSQFFGIKKRLDFSNVLADSARKLKENKAEDFNSFLNDFFQKDSTDLSKKVLSKSMSKRSQAEMKTQSLDITLEAEDDFIIVDEPIVINIRNNATKSESKKRQSQRKSVQKVEDKGENNLVPEEIQSPIKESEVKSIKPNKKKKAISSTVKNQEVSNLATEKIQSPIKEPEVKSIKPNKKKKAILSSAQDQEVGNLATEEIQSPIKEQEIVSKPNKRKKAISSNAQNQEAGNLAAEEIQSPIKEPEIVSKPIKRKKAISSNAQDQEAGNLAAEEIQSPIKEPEIVSKPIKRKKAISSNAQDQEVNNLAVEKIQSPIKETEVKSIKPNKRKKANLSSAHEEVSNLAAEEMQSPIKEPGIKSIKPNKRKKANLSSVQDQEVGNLAAEEIQSPIKEPEIKSITPNKRKKADLSSVQDQEVGNLAAEEIQSPIKEQEIKSITPNKRKKADLSSVQDQEVGNLAAEEIQSPIKEPEVKSIKPNKRKKAISPNVQDEQIKSTSDDEFKDISPLKKSKVNQLETNISKEMTTLRNEKQTRKPPRRGARVTKGQRARKERKAVAKTRHGSRKAKMKKNILNESSESERSNKSSDESGGVVNPDDVFIPQDNSVELNEPGEDLSIDHEEGDKLQSSLQLQNSDLEEEGNKIHEKSRKRTNEQPKSRSRKKSLFKQNSVAQGSSGELPKAAETKNVSTLGSPPPQEGPLSKKNGKAKKVKGKKKLQTSSAETKEESLQATPVHLKLISALPQVTPKSGISFRLSRRLTAMPLDSSSEEESHDGIENGVYSTPRSLKASSGVSTPTGNGNNSILTSCLRGSSTVKHKRKGRRVTINKLVEEQEVSPRSKERRSSSTIASESGLVSMSSSPVHYAETTTNEPIPITSHSPRIVMPDLSHKIVPPESPPQPGLRRSKRTRVMRLNRIRGEGIVYRRDSTGFGLLVAGVQPNIVAAKLKVKEEERRRKLHRRKLQSVTVPALSKKRLSAHRRLSENVTMCSEYPIVDPETENEVLVECMARKSSVNWYGPDLNPVLETDPVAVGLLIQQPSFSTGELHLRPFSEKPLGLAVQTLIYYIVHGKIAVTINEVTTVAEIGDSFFIPRGNLYSVKNLRRDVAKLYFVDLGDRLRELHHMSHHPHEETV